MYKGTELILQDDNEKILSRYLSPWLAPDTKVIFFFFFLGSNSFFFFLHMHVCVLLKILSPFRLLYNIGQSSLCYSIDPYGLPILSIVVYTCQSQTP